MRLLFVLAQALAVIAGHGHEWRGAAAKPGVFRVTVCQGSWLLEPAGEGKTRATYSLFTDSGIVGPAFLANTISETGISKLFAAVRKQVKNPKYQSK